MSGAPLAPSSLWPAGEELLAWLRLALTPGLGRGAARRLLVRAGSAQAVWELPAQSLVELLTPRQVQALGEEPPQLAAQYARSLQWLQQPGDGLAHGLITLGHAQYPESLLQTADPPLMLFVQGAPERLYGAQAWFPYPQALAIVGSRNPTPQGASNARLMAQALAQAGLCVVSGLALGIDAAAHEGALLAVSEQDGVHLGPPVAIAVVGTGLDQVYPAQHQGLALRVARQGLVVSEYLLGAPPLAAHFPQRNRIIAGLAQGTLVVEAALRSGSLVTARLASEQGREVFAVPGSIHAPQSRGCHALLRQGAKLVETAQDVLEELQGLAAQARVPVQAQAQPGLPAAPEDSLLQALGYDPLDLDTLVERTGWSAAQLQARLLEWEMSGVVARLPGGRFQRQAQA